MDLPEVIDLRRLADDIAHQPEFAQLAGWLRTAGRAQSCVADLRQARMCIEVHESIRLAGDADRPDLRTIQQSLLTSAVTLYARATVSTKQYGERGPIQIADKLPPELKVDHDAIIKLRNRVVAHVYLNEGQAEGIWHEQFMFAVTGEPGPVCITTRTTQTRLATIERLQRLLPLAESLVVAQFHKHLVRATEALNANNPPINFDAYLSGSGEYFGSEEMARAVLSQRGPGNNAIIFTEDVIAKG